MIRIKKYNDLTSAAIKSCFAIFCAALIILNSCDSGFPDDCFKNTGELVWENREIASFKTILLTDNVDLYIYPDTFNFARVYAGENLIDKVITEINDTILVIKNTNTCNWTRDYKKPIEVHLNTKTLQRIEYQGYGNIKTMSPIEGHSFRIRIIEGHGNVKIESATRHVTLSYQSGTADVSFQGEKIVYLGIFNGGLGVVNSLEMDCNIVYINHMSNNNAFINAKDSIITEIHMNGNVYYKGNPAIRLAGRYGEGDIYKID
ncbi:MAG: DUF2807 domain-containing protein [Bacteroidetes bacterium]|nr:DUF2807 domain-containing protein [Bacteroidota bacterium]